MNGKNKTKRDDTCNLYESDNLKATSNIPSLKAVLLNHYVTIRKSIKTDHQKWDKIAEKLLIITVKSVRVELEWTDDPFNLSQDNNKQMSLFIIRN